MCCSTPFKHEAVGDTHHARGSKRHEGQSEAMAAQHMVTTFHVLEGHWGAVAVICKGGKQRQRRRASGRRGEPLSNSKVPSPGPCMMCFARRAAIALQDCFRFRSVRSRRRRRMTRAAASQELTWNLLIVQIHAGFCPGAAHGCWGPAAQLQRWRQSNVFLQAILRSEGQYRGERFTEMAASLPSWTRKPVRKCTSAFT